ncbi:cbb3-type cytochrome c oxidase subunit II [Pseudomonas sp. zfem004]|uniref:cbb3-type cytochrome c oxidase subunit II n=1 Tax=unclassified Pseudomonas TaxID=196821 RepID=UPI00129B772E|nr:MULTISPECIES: cbb3-type cytochrome c oxidase subunit II [unclassified Pseudomonas]MDU9404186.1 cbb3-type cytochrome c oxidase subunit II [Pseudomonas sp. zfem004]
MQTIVKHRLFNSAYLIIFVAGIGFFLLSFMLLGILPGKELQKNIDARAPANMPDYTAQEERGRAVYGREGCGYCHTQQVRFIDQDVARWGMPTEAWETKFDYPQLWGTRRIGPDLARETGVRTNDWQLTHLYNPRYTVSDSVMPGYPWLFEGAADKPTSEGMDLVAYLQTLGRARKVSGYDDQGGVEQPASGSTMPEGTDAALDPRQSPIAATPQLDGPVPGLVMPQNSRDLALALRRGPAAYALNCASCHGAQGAGDGPAAASLLPRPANLRDAAFTTERLADVLWNGRPATSMPAWRDLDSSTLAALAVYVQSLHVPKIAPAAPAEVALGKSLFESNCASCHGIGGKGDGPAARGLSPRPTNFQAKQGNPDYLLNILRNGVPGTAMPPWKLMFSDEQQSAVVAYLRSLYQPSEKE